MYSIIFQRNKVTNQIGFLYRFTFFFAIWTKKCHIRNNLSPFFRIDKMPFFSNPTSQKIRSEKGHFKKLLAQASKGSILKPAFCTVDITSCSVMPSDFTVSTLSLLAVSTSQWQMPSALSKCGFTDAIQPPQLMFVLN